MGRGEFIENRIWSDPDFDELSLGAGMLYLWSFTNPRCNMAGLYKCSERAMLEAKSQRQRLPIILQELEQARFLFYVDGVVWVRTRAKYIHSRNPSIATAVAKDVLEIGPSHPLCEAFLFTYAHDSWLQGEFIKKGLVKPKLDNVSATCRRVLGAGACAGAGGSVVSLRASER